MANNNREDNTPKTRKLRINPGFDNGGEINPSRVSQPSASLSASGRSNRTGKPVGGIPETAETKGNPYEKRPQAGSSSPAASRVRPISKPIRTSDNGIYKERDAAGKIKPAVSPGRAGRENITGKHLRNKNSTGSPVQKSNRAKTGYSPQPVKYESPKKENGVSAGKSGPANHKSDSSYGRTVTPAARKKFDTRLLVILLAVVVLIPTVYFAGRALGLISDPSENIGPVETTNNTVESTGLDINSEEFLLAKELTSSEIIYPGVFLDGESFANLTKEQARDKLREMSEELKENTSLILVTPDKNIVATFAELDIALNIEGTLNEMWSYGRQSLNNDKNMQIMERYREIKALEEQPVNLPYIYVYSEGKVETNLHALLATVAKDPVPAKAISFNEERVAFNIEPEVVGVTVDYKSAVGQIKNYLAVSSESKRILVDTELIYPDVTAADLQKPVHLLAEASTPIMSQHSGRMSNLRRADELLNGSIIQPGETFSYWGVLGPITEANGYENASVLVSGQYVDGMGGGLCQPSTTLFQAAAKAGLTIIERRNHGLVGTYFDPGTDAMVSGWSDLKFRNDSNQPVAIIGKTTSKTVTYRIYGNTKAPNVTIKLTAEKIGQDVKPGPTVYIEDKTLAPGKVVRDNRAITGTTWQTYLEYYEDGNFVKKEKLWRSRYKAKAETYRVAVGYIPAGYPGATTTVETTLPSTEASTPTPVETSSSDTNASEIESENLLE